MCCWTIWIGTLSAILNILVGPFLQMLSNKLACIFQFHCLIVRSLLGDRCSNGDGGFNLSMDGWLEDCLNESGMPHNSDVMCVAF